MMEHERTQGWLDGLDEETLSIVHELMELEDGDDETEVALLPGDDHAIAAHSDEAAESVGAAPTD